jgi:23S rRNA-/tRNA-specific pseudouridylate synthase
MELDITYKLIMLLSRKIYISASKILLKNKSKLHVLHQSDNFLVVNKQEDLLINTNDAGIKVRMTFFYYLQLN